MADIDALNLTEQEKYLYQHHVDNLKGSGKVVQPNGDISTLLQAVVTGPDDRYYNIPTVWNGKVLTPQNAAKRAASEGWDKWPSYDSVDEAEARYGKMHDYMDQEVGKYLEQHPMSERDRRAARRYGTQGKD